MNQTILIIEDNEQNMYLMRYLLETRGYNVVSAADGTDAVALACSCRPAVILLDIQLPGKDGYMIAGDLRACPQLRGVPIVAVTSYAMVGDRERILAAGASDYIEKPIDPYTFVDRVASNIKPTEKP